MASSLPLPSRPMSVKEISDQAQTFEWNANIPLKAWIRTAHTLHNEGEIYMREGNFAQAYLLYLRYSTLVLDLLSTHPESKTPEGKKAIRSKMMTMDVVMTNLEKIKPIIQRDYENWKASEARRRERHDHQKAEREKSQALSAYERHASKDPALSSAARLLDAGEHQELAVDLAQKEIRRRDADRKATRIAGVSPQEEQHRRIAGFWDNWTNELADKQAEDEDAFRRQMESTRNKLDGNTEDNTNAVDVIHGIDRPRRDSARSSATLDGRSSSYHYPSIAKSEPIQYDAQRARLRRDLPPQPPRPPKEYPPQRYEDSSSQKFHHPAPELPAKVQIYPDRTPPTPEQSQELPALPPKIYGAPPSPAKKQQRLTFRPAAYLENGEPMRPVFLPSQLRQSFLSIASENTRRGLEMCGILCGTAVNNALFVRCLLIPEQKCTSDTCETENENTMLDYCMSEDLLILGWIHTHPTQTCFMSSRDLHTQSGYQVMLPESIAIVCAPKFQPSYGIFRLTNPPGLPHVLQCTQKATFHQHSVDNLYTESEHPPGHVYENEKLEFYVKDLRPGARNSTVQNRNF
ncbi:hypothetical protein F5X99DRAFT_395022 [Biscogniauxia marginata]|nr:hypothetical protein F5X99DRAFT_395022 [Biscogniauxia marginata]